ncbi:VENN motif pre-toxin domain-containing protein [Mannheimia haemolytica]
MNNEQGFIHSNKQLDVSVASNINNQQGILNSNEGLTLNAAQIDNKAGSITAKTAEVNAKAIDNTAMSDKGSLILGTTQLVLNAEQLDNQNTKRKTTDKAPTQGIQAGQLMLNSNMFSNQRGGVYVTDAAAITVNQTLDNFQGEVLSENTLTIKDNGNLSLNNQEGLIQAKNRLNLTAKTLEQEGSIKTQGDLTVRLKDSFTLNNAFEVGNNLDFSTQGNFTNNVALLIGNKATLAANQIINTASGEISSKNSKLTANEITNRGLIDGEKTLLNATEINNIGTGRIYGDHLSLKAKNINNLAETVDGKVSSATIAARERLALGIDTLINRDGAYILSLGQADIGNSFDENGNVIGNASLIQNESATIEFLGNSTVNAQKIENRDIHVSTTIREEKEEFDLYGRENSTTHTVNEWYRNGVDGEMEYNNGQRHKRAVFMFYDKTRSNEVAYRDEYWQRKKYTQTKYIPEIQSQASAKFLVGGNLNLNSENALNLYSQLMVGGKLFFNSKEITESNEKISSNQGVLINQDLEATMNIHNDGYFYRYYQDRCRPKKWKTKRFFFDEKIKKDIDQEPPKQIKFDLLQLSQVAAGLAGGLASSSGSSLSTAQAVKTGLGIGKNAVENNFFDDLHPSEERKQTIVVMAKALIEGIEGAIEVVQHFDETIVTIAKHWLIQSLARLSHTRRGASGSGFSFAILKCRNQKVHRRRPPS